MSFQYNCPYGVVNSAQYIFKPYGYNQNTVVQNNSVTNPYQTSFYNNSGIIYPYFQLVNQFDVKNEADLPYCKIGQITNSNNETIHFYQLQNGHKVAILPRKNASNIVKTFINAGSMNETDEKRGVSHVNEHGLFKGSLKFNDGDVFRLVGSMGASTNASTDFANVDYYISAPYLDKDNLKKAIEIQGDMIYNPKFDIEAMESEKAPICSEISMMNDNPINVAYDRLIRDLFQIQSNSKNLVAGSIDTVMGLKQDDMFNYHQTYYEPSNMTTVIVCDEENNLDDIMNQVEKSFKSGYVKDKKIPIKKELLNPINVSKRTDIRSSKTNSTTVMLGFCGPKPNETKDFILNQLFNNYISGFSTSELKDSLFKLNSIYSNDTQRVGLNDYDPYALIVAIDTYPNCEQKCLDAFYDMVKKMQTTLISNEDLQALKNKYKKSFIYNLQDSSVQCDMIGSCVRDNTCLDLKNELNILDSITAADILNFARKYYNLNKTSIVIVHPTTVTNEDIKRNYEQSKYNLKNINKDNKTPQISFGSIKNLSVDDVQNYCLSNNTNLILNDSNSDLCVFDWTINTSLIKPKNPNIPGVLTSMLENGSQYKNKKELDRILELNAISTAFDVNEKKISVGATCLSENCATALEIMNEQLFRPNLTQNDFDEAIKAEKDYLNSIQKDATETLLDKLYPGFFPTKEQRLQTIDNLTLDDVKEFYQELLKNASSSFVASAPFKNNPNIANLIIAYQNMPNIKFKQNVTQLEPIFFANDKPRVIYDTDDLNQAQICQSYKFPISGNIYDEVKFEMVHSILGATPNARLFQDLREKQNLAYSVSSGIQQFENTGILTLNIQTTTDDKQENVQSFDNVQKSLEGFKKHIELLQNEYVSDEELQSAKNRLKQNLLEDFQDVLYKTNLLVQNSLEPYGIKRIDKYLEAIDKITKQDIMDAAKYIFSYNPIISVLASPDTIKSQMPYLKTLGEVQNV